MVGGDATPHTIIKCASSWTFKSIPPILRKMSLMLFQWPERELIAQGQEFPNIRTQFLRAGCEIVTCLNQGLPSDGAAFSVSIHGKRLAVDTGRWLNNASKPYHKIM
jgi:hypothetical protein